MDKKQRNFIIRKLRDLSKMYSERSIAKKRQKRDKATFECECCGVYNYEGTKTLEKLLEGLELPPNVKIVKEKGEMDHKIPVGTFDTWDGIINRIYCDADNWAYLCKTCHLTKSALESGERADNRKSKKKSKKTNKKLDKESKK